MVDNFFVDFTCLTNSKTVMDFFTVRFFGRWLQMYFLILTCFVVIVIHHIVITFYHFSAKRKKNYEERKKPTISIYFVSESIIN